MEELRKAATRRIPAAVRVGAADTRGAFLARPPEWMAQGLCVSGGPKDQPSPDDWHQEPRSLRTRFAREVCSICPVRRECQDFAISRMIVDGIWGGLTEAQLRALVKVAHGGKRRRSAALDAGGVKRRNRRRPREDNVA